MRIKPILRTLYHSFIQKPTPFSSNFMANFANIALKDTTFPIRILDHPLHRSYKGFSYKALH